MADALIGHTGFVGGTLLRQRGFDELYRSTNIDFITGKEFDVVVCAGASAQKWIANREPAADRAKIDALISRLSTIRCSMFVLISTVDVFKHAAGVDEASAVDESGLHMYGSNRRVLEKFVARNFSRHLIVRLPGLVGPGLRKNVIYDFLNHNNLHAIDARGCFQFYPMVNLWHDVQIAIKAGLTLVHLTAEPITVAEVSQEGFGRPFETTLQATPAKYDFRSRHAALFGADAPYQYSKRETLLAVRTFAQSEPPTPTVAA